MEARAKKYGIQFNPGIYNLDLFLVVQGHSGLRESLPNLKQKTLEVFMGLADSRDDEISGGDSVALYEKYMQTHAFALEKTILLHNHDDLLQLYKLLPVISKTDFHRAMYKLGFSPVTSWYRRLPLRAATFIFSGNSLTVPKTTFPFQLRKSPAR